MIDAAIVMIKDPAQTHGKTPITPANRWEVVAGFHEVGRQLFFSLLVIGELHACFCAGGSGKAVVLHHLRTLKPTPWRRPLHGRDPVPVLMGWFVRGRIPAGVVKSDQSDIDRALPSPCLRTVMRFPLVSFPADCRHPGSPLMPLRDLGSEFMPPLDEGDRCICRQPMPASRSARRAKCCRQGQVDSYRAGSAHRVWQGLAGRIPRLIRPR